MTVHRLFAIAAASLVSACTFAPGGAFAMLKPGSMSVTFTPDPGRLNGVGALKTDLSYRVYLTHLAISVDRIVIQSETPSASTSQSTVAFDPAKPPAGYTLCHGGHCHRQDGALVEYADVQAELKQGGGSQTKDVITFLIGPLYGLNSPTFATWTPATGAITPDCVSTCPVDQGTWTKAVVTFGTLNAAGDVSDGTTDARLGQGKHREWRLAWKPPAITKRLSVSISRKSPPVLQPMAQFQLSDQLFDQIEWSSLPNNNEPIVLDGHPEIIRLIEENFAKSTFSLQFTQP